MSICTSIKNPYINAPVEHIHQFIYNMISSKDLDRKVYDYIYPWVETIASVMWGIIKSYHHNLGFMPGQAVFGRDMLFKLKSIVDWRVVTARKQR